MKIKEHLDKNNLHHAYLIEGIREEILPELIQFIKSLGVDTDGNGDFIHISADSFKIEDARNLKSYSAEKGFSDSKKIFVISANSFLLEAQHSLLKMFEEPIENSHFFVVIPDADSLLKTLVSRFYFISTQQDMIEYLKDAEKFISMPLQERINFLKELLAEDEESEEIAILNSSRSKSSKFLNALESVLSKKIFETGVDCFEHIFKIREFLRQPGSSTKSLMESVALVIPDFKNRFL